MNRPEWDAKDNGTWISILVIIAAIVLMFFAAFARIKQNEQVNTIMCHCNKTYYVDSYTISGDYITAIDIRGQKILLPKDSTVIRVIKE